MASISQEERARIMANNKSLRIIKNELDQLLERGGITDEQYGTFVDNLPAEASLRNVSTSTPGNNTSSASNIGSLSIADRQQANSPSPAPATDHAPPAYHNQTPPPPPRNEGPPELCRAVALYQYAGGDSRDLSFETGDQISVTAYANNEWWSGKNLRTGHVGIFPANYVRVEPAQTSYYGNNEKTQAGYYGAQTQPVNNMQNPYSSPVPPMAIANQPEPQQQQAAGETKGNKAGAMGKKFGKKLGNAAIFGAGATLGADLVNSIF